MAFTEILCIAGQLRKQGVREQCLKRICSLTPLLVAEMALAANPKDTVAMVHKANAYYLQLQTRYVSRYPRPVDIPKDKQADFQRLSLENLAWFAKAEQLGWTPKTPEQEEKYLQSIKRQKWQRGT